MAPPYPATLTLAERVVRALAVLNLLYGAGVLLLLIASLIAPTAVFSALAGRTATGADGAIRAMQLLMLVGLAAVPVIHVIIVRLRAMLVTVRAGDPFILGNARRLDTIAICVLALEVLHLIVGAIVRSDALTALDIHLGWSFSVTPWVGALLLLVLARVFEQGARMRVDLEGTV